MTRFSYFSFSASGLAAILLLGGVACDDASPPPEEKDASETQPTTKSPGETTTAGTSNTPPAAAGKTPGKTSDPGSKVPGSSSIATAPPSETPEVNMEALLDPSKCSETAPDVFKAKFETSKGDFVIEVHRDWSPNGADRFYNLVKTGYYNDVRFFRVVEGFMVQFGIHGDPNVSAKWRRAKITDDPVKKTNERGKVTFATGGKDTRTTQVFINYANNAGLDRTGFSPFGEVIEGMETVDALYGGYGDGPPQGRGPAQGQIQVRGNEYLESSFGELDYVTKAYVVP